MTCLVIGESLIDVVKSADRDTIRHPGGSPMNVAVGLARLGRHVRLLTRIGDDTDGDTIRRYVEDAGVELVDGAVDSDATSIAIAALDEHGSPTYSFDVHSAYLDPPTNPDKRAQLIKNAPQHVHIGSIGAHLRPGADTVKRWIELFSPYSTISYDPNVRLSILGSAESVIADMAALLPYVDIVKVSTADLEELAGHPVNPDDAAHRFLAAGITFVAITLGKNGVKLYTPQTHVYIPAPQVDIVDTVGAGDAMMSALIDALARISVLGDDRAGLATVSSQMLASVGQYANAAAGITVSRTGANPPTRDELNDAATNIQF